MSEPTTAAPVRDYTKEAKEIFAIGRNLTGKVENIMELAQSAVEAGKSVDEFRAEALNKLPEIKPLQKPVTSDINPKDMAKYSIGRAIRAQLGGKLDGIEREVNDEIALKTGSRASGFWVPEQAFVAPDWKTRSFVAGTGNVGGFLVETSNLGSEFVELLRNKAQVLRLGARTLNLTNPVTIPRQAAAGASNWVAETTAATLDAGTFSQLTLTPFGVSAFQQYSKQLLYTNDPSIDSLIRDDIMQIIGLAIDRAALHGSGSPQPTGIAGTTGINTVALAASGQALANTTAYPFMVSLETEVAADNADMGSLAYLMRAGHRGALKVSSRFASTDTPVWEPNNTVNGYRAEVTQQIATNLTTGTATTICSAIFFGNWADLLVANFNGGATDIVVDPYVLAANAVVRIIARRWVDVGVRHPTSFCVGGGILTT